MSDEIPDLPEEKPKKRTAVEVNAYDCTAMTARLRPSAVMGVALFAKESFPAQDVHGDIDHAGLRLSPVGDYDAREGYQSNIVVFAALVDDSQH